MARMRNNDTDDFQDHPEGSSTGIVYCWKYMGEKTNSYGDVKKKLMLRIESMDEFMEDGRPFSVGIFHNLSWGVISKKSSQFATMQQLREDILDITLTAENWNDFDPEDLMDARISYRVRYEPKLDGNGHWVNVDRIMRLEDQTLGKRVNDIQVVMPPDEEGGEQAGDSQETPSAGRPSPEELLYITECIEFLASKDVLDEAKADAWSMWANSADLTQEAVKNNFPKLVAISKNADLELPARQEKKVDPKSTGDDDLPFN